MTMRILMHPGPNSDIGVGGISTVIAAYAKHFPRFGMELVGPGEEHDLVLSHAGAGLTERPSKPLVAYCHGLYWTAEYDADPLEYQMNAQVIQSLRWADAIVVPSDWVAETIKRDMRLTPHVIGHGIDMDEWESDKPDAGYVFWNKNRTSDVCDPTPVNELAKLAPETLFLSTFAAPDPTPNVRVTGLLPHDVLKQSLEKAGVYLATTKETFGVGILEAMACGVPVLGFDWGGAADLVQHGITGYLARPNDYNDLLHGLRYCQDNRADLGRSARERARGYTWQLVVEQLRDQVFKPLLEAKSAVDDKPTITVVIPAYNTKRYIAEAVDSVLAQTRMPDEIIIVDNGSTDGTLEIAERYKRIGYGLVSVRYEKEKGVAHARNNGIAASKTKYVCCLDSDDRIEPDFLDMLVPYLEAHPDVAVAYSGLALLHSDGHTDPSLWPGEYSYDEFLQGKNQIPTCCVLRRKAWERVGGYRQRYAPSGAGTEDAEFWLRLGAYGFTARRVTPSPLFLYRAGAGITARNDYKEVDWRAWHPWVRDGQHPFLSAATPTLETHRVRSYDRPTVSVVIPCAPHHVKYLVDAIDSLEAQTFRRWEAIVVFDGNGKQKDQTEAARLLKAYPYIRHIVFNKSVGAGAARNAGAKIAKAPYLLFLDADDWLTPNALATLLRAAIADESIAYSDYLGHAFIDKEMVRQLQREGRLESFNEADGKAIIRYYSADYDCELATRQPDVETGDFYIWNLVSSLVPKSWHDEIEGFDESMASWEDWDYWLRMARAGKCFSRVAVPLVEYRFYTGNRREEGRQSASSLVKYLTDKLKGAEVMPCGGCSKRRQREQEATAQSAPVLATFGGNLMSSSDLVLVRLNDGNQGQHPIVGSATRTSYGYRQTGDEFLVKAEDYAEMADRFIKLDEVAPAEMARIERTAAVKPTSVAALPGIRPSLVKALEDAGIQTAMGVVTAGKGGLTELPGIGEKTADELIAAAKKLLNK